MSPIITLYIISSSCINIYGIDGIYQFLKKSCKYLGLRIEEPGRNTRNEAILDFIICGKNISIKDEKNPCK